MGRSTTRRLVAAGALAGATTAVIRGVSRRREVIAPVAPDLRSPVLYVPLELRSDRALRAVRALTTRATIPAPRDVEVTERLVERGGAAPRVLCYERPDRPRPSSALVWIHGGGMVLGLPEQDHAWAGRLASDLGILVVSVDYRLAPEHPFPAALDDCAAALAWVHDQADDLGVDVERIAVGGASAGGGLAASLCQHARDEGGPAICFQLLNYPMLDDRTVLATDHGDRGRFVWTPGSNRFGWSAYLGRAPLADDAPRHAAPARTADLAGLPPAWIGVGDLDLFHPEDVDYAERLRAAGVPCDLHVEPGMYHAADQVVRQAPRMAAYRDRMVEALGTAIG